MHNRFYVVALTSMLAAASSWLVLAKSASNPVQETKTQFVTPHPVVEENLPAPRLVSETPPGTAPEKETLHSPAGPPRILKQERTADGKIIQHRIALLKYPDGRIEEREVMITATPKRFERKLLSRKRNREERK